MLYHLKWWKFRFLVYLSALLIWTIVFLVIYSIWIISWHFESYDMVIKWSLYIKSGPSLSPPLLQTQKWSVWAYDLTSHIYFDSCHLINHHPFTLPPLHPSLPLVISYYFITTPSPLSSVASIGLLPFLLSLRLNKGKYFILNEDIPFSTSHFLWILLICSSLLNFIII